MELLKMLEQMALERGAVYIGAADLGLAGEFVRRQGGALVESYSGAISVGIPLPRGLVEPPEAARPPGNTDRLVLLVEDDPDVRRVVRMQLTDLGYPVLEAENGPEAVSIIANVPDIAIMLSDIVMPGGIDGWELARLAKKSRPKMRIVLMSGYAYGNSEEEATDTEDPQLPMLSKPFEKRQLANILQITDS